MNAEAKHPIKAVARRTGLSTHVIRAWEKRYAALEPQRTKTNRRLYSDDDIERLSLLKRATETGHNIGQIARLPIDDLQKMIAADTSANGGSLRKSRDESSAVIEFHIKECLSAVIEMSGERLDLCLRRASVAVSQPVLLEGIVIPLMERIGAMWERGQLRVAHEHLATAIVRNFLGSLTGSYQVAQTAPAVVIGTPSGQSHELGAVLASVTAMAAGWRVVYLGPDTPANEFIHVAQESSARAVALSVIYPPDDPRLAGELKKIRQMLPTSVEIIIGGRAASSYHSQTASLNLRHINSLSDLRSELSRLRGVVVN